MHGLAAPAATDPSAESL